MIYRNILGLIVGFLTITQVGFSQDTLLMEDLETVYYELEDPFLNRLDSLTGVLLYRDVEIVEDSLISWHIKENRVPFTLTDEELLERLNAMNTEIPMDLHPDVKRNIKYLVERGRSYVTRMLAHSQVYFPLFEETLDRKGLPEELKVLPVIESAFDPAARSYMGATGLWQIMHRTGKILGLEINNYVDERMDPIQSTEAATDYLAQMYGIYDDWLLALAAYNAGPGNVNKAIARAGGVRDFWKIRPHLPVETQKYVPTYLATTYVIYNYEKHGLISANPRTNIFEVDTIRVFEKVSLKHVSNVVGITEEELKFLNPALKKGIIPKLEDGYPLNIGAKYMASFEYYRSAIEEDTSLTKGKKIESEVVYDPSYFVYTVKGGDNLGFIAERFSCSVKQIKAWNGLRGNFLDVGQKLTLYISESAYNKGLKAANGTSTVKTDPAKQVGYTKDQMDLNCNCDYHTIAEGDNLWDLSQKYNLSIDEIRAANNIPAKWRLKLGVILKMPKS